MPMEADGLDRWRAYFKTASSSIFEVIEHGIHVAAVDSPEEFKLRRGKIARKLYSFQCAGVSGCAAVEVSTTTGGGGGDNHPSGYADPKGKAKASSMEDENHLHEVDDRENEIVGEVLKIKDLITSCQNESERVFFDALKRLQLMPVSVKILKVTMVGKAVNDLRKCSSKQISQLAKTLIEGWQVVVDECICSMEAVSAAEAVSVVADEGSADDSNPRVIDEKELPSLPLNDREFPSVPWSESELLFVPMSAVSLEYLNSFFDGLDEDGNVISSAVNKGERMEQEPAVKPLEVPRINLPTTNPGPSKRVKPSLEAKVNNEAKSQKKSDKYAMTTRKRTSQFEPLNGSNVVAIQGKPEAKEPKLEGYQQTENAKRPKTTRFLDFSDVPTQIRWNSPRQSRSKNQPSH